MYWVSCPYSDNGVGGTLGQTTHVLPSFNPKIPEGRNVHTQVLTHKLNQRQGGVTPIDSIVTAATTLVNPYTKEGVKSQCILLYTSINVRVVSSQQLNFNTVNGQSPEHQCGQQSNTEKSWSKLWPVVVAVTVESMGVTPLREHKQW